MKKRNGFTLIELIVGMAVTMLILGGIVAVVRGGFGSMLTGQSQATAYANARAVMEDITTTLRYASGVELGTGTITYSGPVEGMTVNNYSDAKPYKRVITWDSSGDNLRLKIVKDDDANNPIYFPANSSNSAFTSAEYVKAYADMNGTASDRFPIFKDTYDGEEVYNIILPVKYDMSGTTASKIDVLRSKISASEIVNDIEGKISIDKDQKAQEIGNILAIAVTNAYNNNQGILRTGNGIGNFTTNISSIGFHKKNSGDKLAGISANLWSTIPKDKQAIVGDTSWVIVPCDASGNVISKDIKSVVKWKIFVARNVVDDVPDPDKNYKRLYDYTTQNQNRLKDSGDGMTEIKRLAVEDGVYVIRPWFGFMTYCFTTKGQTSEYETTDLAKTFGYATAIYNASLIYINYNTWVPILGSDGKYTNYKTLKNGQNDYIEDYNGTGKHYRLDYDGAGAEYTKDTEGTTYVYPGLLPDVASDKTKW